MGNINCGNSCKKDTTDQSKEILTSSENEHIKQPQKYQPIVNPKKLESIATDQTNKINHNVDIGQQTQPSILDQYLRPSFSWNAAQVGKGVVLSGLNMTCKSDDTNHGTCLGDFTFSTGKMYYFEVRIIFSGNEVLQIGVSMKNNDLNQRLGQSIEGWSLDPKSGDLLHNGEKKNYCGSYVFQSGDTIGIALNTEKGQLQYFINGNSMGVAFQDTELCLHELYPSSSLSHGSQVTIIRPDI